MDSQRLHSDSPHSLRDRHTFSKIRTTLPIPDLSIFAPLLKATGERTMSTTMALVRLLVAIARNKEIGPRLVPIVPDEARTFGMEGMFRQVGIYAPEGQKYEPMDAADIMPYKESARVSCCRRASTKMARCRRGSRRRPRMPTTA